MICVLTQVFISILTKNILQSISLSSWDTAHDVFNDLIKS